METYPEIDKLLGKTMKPRTRTILFLILFIFLIVITIIFLIATGYINIGSPTNQTIS